jgi:oleate hydratase
VTDLDHETDDGKFVVTGIHCLRLGKREAISVNEGDLVFMQNGSMTDASSLGSMTSAPRKLTKCAARRLERARARLAGARR